MSTLIDSPRTAIHIDGCIKIEMVSGEVIEFQINDNPRLCGASHEQLNNIELSPFGLHWPDLDEDLSIRGLVAGDFGQESKMP